MRIPRIYSPVELIPETSVELDERASHHLLRVLRMEPGQPLCLFNGDGNEYPAELAEGGRKSARVRVLECRFPKTESPLTVRLAQVISKGDRMDYAIQKSVELGVHEIQPLISERCDVRLTADREEKRVRHWQQVAISAAEQCGRARVPTVPPLVSLDEWLGQPPDADLRLVLHHRGEGGLTAHSQPGRLDLLIGPEGGLSEPEIEAARSAGFIPATFGPRVLRTETAPVVALSLCQWLWGDLRTDD